MATRQNAKPPGRLQRVIHGILVPFAMALSAAAFSTGLYAQASFGLVSSAIAGITLFLVMLCAQSAYVGSQRAAYAVQRLNELETAVEGGARHDGGQFAQMVELTEKVGQIDEMAARMSLIDGLAEKIEKLDREIVRTKPDRALMDPTRVQRLGAEIDRLGARQEALRTQLQIETRERFDEVSSEIQMLEMLVKQLAENVANFKQPAIEQQVRQELPPPAEEAIPDQSADNLVAEERRTPPDRQAEAAPVPETAPEPEHVAEEVSQTAPAPELQPEVRPAAEPAVAAKAPAPAHSSFEPTVDELPMMDEVRQSIESNRIELFLQPIMMLPQRRVRYYEALTRLRGESGSLLMPKDYLGLAESAGVMSVIDNVMLYRSVQVLRRLEQRSSARGVFCNISAHSLLDAEFFSEFISFMDQNRNLAQSMYFEFSQSMIENCGVVEEEGLSALAEMGFRFSLDQVYDLDIDFQAVQNRGFRFIKLDAEVLLHGMSEANAQIHAADMRSYLERYGIQLIASKIEDERTLSDVLDYHVKLGQGYIFSEPRPVRPEVFERADSGAEVAA